jgi:hypothetical protein
MNRSKIMSTLAAVFPVPLIMSLCLLPFIMQVADLSFLLGFCISTAIFFVTILVALDDEDELEQQKKEAAAAEAALPVDESQGLAFYLREGCVEVRTQDGRRYRWMAEAEGLNLMAKGGIRCGVFHTQDDLAFLEFWEPEVTLYQATLNPWAASTDVKTHVKDFQVLAA